MDTLLLWLKRLGLSKTIVANGLLLAAYVLKGNEIQAFISPTHAAEALTIINIVLRFFTYMPLQLKA